MLKLHLHQAGTLPRLGPNHQVIGYNISGAGEALVMYSQARGENRQQLTLAITKASGWDIFEFDDTDIRFPTFDIFRDGRIFVADSRCSWRSKNDFDRNGFPFDAQGKLKTQILVGDGVKELFVDDAERVWVSYFDEGIFGNNGWGQRGAEPVGASGLNVFSSNSEILWRYIPPTENLRIDDCYSLNVFDRGAYIYSYSAFPVCKIDEQYSVKSWKTDLAGCTNLVVFDNYVLLRSAYGDQRNVAYFGCCEAGALRIINKIELTLPPGSQVGNGQFVSRGASIYYFDDEAWFRGDIKSLVGPD